MQAGGRKAPFLGGLYEGPLSLGQLNQRSVGVMVCVQKKRGAGWVPCGGMGVPNL